jgi:hemolysin activation/secretion protein
MSHARSLAGLLVGLLVELSTSAASATADPPSVAADERDSASSVAVFDVFEFRVLGNTTLPAPAVERAVYPFLGEGRALADVQGAAKALEQAYRDAGYSTVYVDVPEQDVDEGVVRLQVTEARLGEVRISGTRYFSNRMIRGAAPSLTPGVVPHFPSIQQDLAVVNRSSADLQVTPVLRSGSVPGTVDVELKARDQLPFHGSLELNNRYTADTTPTRASVTLGYDWLFGRPQSLSLQYQTAPEEPDEARVLAATYVARSPETGRAFAVYAVDSDSDVATVGVLNVLGKGQILGTRYIVPLQTSAERSLAVALGLDYKNFDETINIDADSTLVTPIEYLNASIVVSGTRRLDHAGTRWDLSWAAGPRFGSRQLFNDADEFADKRYLGRPNYFYLAADGQVRVILPLDYTLALRASGQYSVEPLVSNEQFGLGGASTVRGYLESEQIGDYGAFGSFELVSPQLAARVGSWAQDLRALAFIDAGYGGIQEPLPGQVRSFDLYSIGVGLRMLAFEGLELNFDWAYPLEDADRTEAGDDRLHFFARYGF